MSTEPSRTSTSGFRHGLTFIATIAFVTTFFGSRLFATLFPSVVLMRAGIHVHHFWYGIGLMSVAGWMGIAWRQERFYRLYAVLYGLGAGLLGDEVGLLLTLGQYESELTYMFFVGAISAVIIGTLLTRYWNQLQRDLGKLSMRERIALVAAYVGGFSLFVFFLFSGVSLVAVPIALLALAILVLLYTQKKKIMSPKTENKT